MTIPSRPAPAPPGSRGQIAAANANANIEQLRQQLQQQHLQQQQNGGIQRMTIKLPPPPKGPTANGFHIQKTISDNNNAIGNNSTTITRKFPQARYAPATSWDDSPFETVTNGNFKKVPPPRPPPPKVQVNGRKPTAPAPPSTQTTNLITSIFNRKKSTNKSTTKTTSGSRVVYGVSSGTYNSSSTISKTSIGTLSTATSFNATSSYGGVSNSTTNWNANWNTNGFSNSSSSSTNNPLQDTQLISFDSPPSSPTFTQKSNSDCVSVDSFSSDSNFSSPNNGSVSQPESGFEDDFNALRSRPTTTSPLDPWETVDGFGTDSTSAYSNNTSSAIGTAPVRNLSSINTRTITTNYNPLCNGKSLLPPTPSLNMPTIIKPKISQKPKAPKPPILMKQQHYSGGIVSQNCITPPSPPMPQCAPPPPPSGVSLLDVISGKVDAINLGSGATYTEEFNQPYGIALYDFEGVEDGDLNFRENDKIYLLEQVSDEWYRGRMRSGCEGIFPINYIDVKVPLSVGTPAETTTPTTTYHEQEKTQIRCLFNFPAEVPGDLALKENDFVTVLYKINEDWFYGEIDGKQGQFPSSFLEYIPDNIPMP